ncbi:hypothetical protein JCM9279_002504, partial [Rhodotorula babjevae]
MQRPKRAAASKAISFVDTAPSSDDDDEAHLVPQRTPRRSTRPSRSADSHDDAAQLQDDPNPRPAKKPRTSTTATMGKAKSEGSTTTTPTSPRRMGQLSAFLALPLDLVLAVAHDVNLPTLLAMSRANKLLNRLFASRLAAPVWASARRNSGIRDLKATDLNDKQLAALLFDRNCHVCGRSRAIIVDYVLRTRWCKPCRSANLLTASELVARQCVQRMNRRALECSLSFYHHAKRTTYYHLQDVESTSARLNDLVNKVDLAQRLQTSAQPYTNRRRTPEQQVKLDETLQSAADAVVVAEQALDKFVRERRVLVEAAGERLMALGHAATDCIIPLSLDTLIVTAKELTDESESPSSFAPPAEQRKVERVANELRRAASERSWATRRRHEVVRRRYMALLQAQQGEAHVTWPSFAIFHLLPTVETYWIGDAASDSEDDWTTDLPAILAEVDVARRAIKVGFARAIVDTLVVSDAHVDQSLVDNFARPPQPIRPIGSYLRSVAIPDDHYLKSIFEADLCVSLDLGDTAAGVSDAELDGLFSHPTAAFEIEWRRNKAGGTLRYPQIHAELRERKNIGTVGCVSLVTPVKNPLWHHQLAVLAHVGLASLDPADPTLGTRGAIFP